MHIGWDWASEAHDVTVLNDTGQVLDRWAPTHDEAGITATLRRLADHGDPGELAVAIEATHSLVIDRLLAAGHPVVPIHPNAFHATRPRWGASKAKSDPGDSYKLADYLRTEGHRLRRLEPLSTATAELQAIVRMRDDHVSAKVAATNQLRALLERHWPGATSIFARLDSDIALAFLDDYPTPASAARLGEARMKMFCRRHSYCGRRPAAELVDRLRSAPEGTGVLGDQTSPSSSEPRSGACAACWAPSLISTGPPALRSSGTPRPACSHRCPASARSTSRRSSPRSARSSTGPSMSNMPAPKSAPLPSPARRARPTTSTSDGRSTPAPDSRS
jgi:hypothetical protein